MMAKIQRFGGAMFTPVLLFTFSGIMVALTVIFKNPMIVGSIANEGTVWNGIWSILEKGAWTVFNQMELLFVIGLPIGLAKKAQARAALESFVLYMTCNYFISGILEFFGSSFGVDYSSEPGGLSGLKLIAGVKTLDTGVIGAIIIAAITVWIHNRYFDKKLPDFLGIFQGSAFVAIIGYFMMIPVALLICYVWPNVQAGMGSLQTFMVNSGYFGVWLYTFLERLLIPTGLHHFISTPFVYGPAVVEGGLTRYWMEHLNEFAQSTLPMKELYPEGGYALTGMAKIFAPIGIALAFYSTARPEKKKKVIAILIPVTLTAVLAGITEPLEFTFLFVAPPLFIVHAIMAAIMATVMYAFGIVGDLGAGMIEQAAKTWIPLAQNHWETYLLQIGKGIIFIAIYYFLFRILIIKFNFLTPGREVEEDVKLYSKKEYRESKNSDPYVARAQHYLEYLGGKDNIDIMANCATRLRVTVYDEQQVAPDNAFKEAGAHGVVRNGKSLQIIIGLDVPQVKEVLDKLIS